MYLEYFLNLKFLFFKSIWIFYAHGEEKILGFLYPVEPCLAFQYLFSTTTIFPACLFAFVFLKEKSRSLCYFECLNTDFYIYNQVSTSIYLHHAKKKKYIGNNMKIEPPERKNLFG